tara:strand:- start:94 stop:258 length:165 start_codon:yes stop_codon:yes gene_type:complete
MYDFYSSAILVTIVSLMFFGLSFYTFQETEDANLSLFVGALSGFFIIYASFYGY